jgi:allantoinase
MDRLHYEGMPDERAAIARSLDILGKFGKVRGWLSPARSESHQTLDLLARAGIDYVCDWVNDDMPYPVKAGGRTLHAMPHSHDIEDANSLIALHQDEDELREQWLDQFDVLHKEGGRIMVLPLHSWVIGHPYRIGTLESVLAHIMSRADVWPATGTEILDAWNAQQ